MVRRAFIMVLIYIYIYIYIRAKCLGILLNRSSQALLVKNSFQSSMKCQKFSGEHAKHIFHPPCVKSGNLARCPINFIGWTLLRMGGKYISEWPCSIYESIYCRVQWNRVLFIPVQWEKSGHTDHEANQGGSAVPHDNTELRQYRSQPGGCRQIPYIGSERKNSVRKTGERYEHREEKSGSVEIPPLYRIWRTSPAYSCSNTSSWPMSRLYPVLCLDAITRLGKWTPGAINYYYYIYIYI